MSAKTVAAMQAELEAAGYEIEVVDGETVFGRATSPDGWQVEVYYGMFIQNTLGEIYQHNRELATEKAWQHYQRDRQHEAMQRLLEKIAGLYGVLKYSETRALAEEAKALLESMKG